jgi:hypothetical protein
MHSAAGWVRIRARRRTNAQGQFPCRFESPHGWRCRSASCSRRPLVHRRRALECRRLALAHRAVQVPWLRHIGRVKLDARLIATALPRQVLQELPEMWATQAVPTLPATPTLLRRALPVALAVLATYRIPVVPEVMAIVARALLAPAGCQAGVGSADSPTLRPINRDWYRSRRRPEAYPALFHREIRCGQPCPTWRCRAAHPRYRGRAAKAAGAPDLALRE